MAVATPAGISADPSAEQAQADESQAALAAAIDAARDLAWRPTHNLVGIRYPERLESAQRLRERIAEARLPDEAGDELRYLWSAMVRVCVASFANRMGQAYYERKRLVYELRGCLDVYDRATR